MAKKATTVMMRASAGALAFAGALLAGAAPAVATTAAEPASRAASDTSAMTTPQWRYLNCVGQELQVGWTPSESPERGEAYKLRYQIFIAGKFAFYTNYPNGADSFFRERWNPDQVWQIRAEDQTGAFSALSNGRKPNC